MWKQSLMHGWGEQRKKGPFWLAAGFLLLSCVAAGMATVHKIPGEMADTVLLALCGPMGQRSILLLFLGLVWRRVLGMGLLLLWGGWYPTAPLFFLGVGSGLVLWGMAWGRLLSLLSWAGRLGSWLLLIPAAILVLVSWGWMLLRGGERLAIIFRERKVSKSSQRLLREWCVYARSCLPALLLRMAGLVIECLLLAMIQGRNL